MSYEPSGISHRKLDEMSDNVYLKLFARLGVPILLALLSYMVNTQLGQTQTALTKIQELSIDQSLTGLKIDQLKSDLASKTANIYSTSDAAKDQKLQAERDTGQDNSILRLQNVTDDQGKMIRNLEIGVKP